MSAIGPSPRSVVSSRPREESRRAAPDAPLCPFPSLKSIRTSLCFASLCFCPFALEDLCFVLELVDELRHVGHLPSPRTHLGRGQKEEADLRTGVHPEGIRRDHLHLLLLRLHDPGERGVTRLTPPA